MYRFLVLFFFLFSSLLRAQIPFEQNILIEARNFVEQITPLGENFLVRLKGIHPYFNTSS
jgi:hypothetical protein